MAESSASQPAPHTIVEDWNAICRKVDKEMDVPEVVYEFSNGTKKMSTDRTNSGIYGLTGGAQRFLADEQGRIILNENNQPIQVNY